MKIAIHFATPLDHTSFYRALGPLTQLEHDRKDIQLVVRQNMPEFPEVMGVDVAMVHRPFRPEHLETIKRYQRHGVPVWVDYDDDFMNVTQDSTAYDALMNPETWGTVAGCLKRADAVSLATPELMETYKPYLPTEPKKHNMFHVIPNAIPDRLWERRRPFISNIDQPNRRILWRGNSTHQRDIRSVEQQVVDYAMANPTTEWVFMGYDPWWITEKFMKANIPHICIKWIPTVMGFFDELLDLAPNVVMVPLDDTTFNRGKSNIAWLEAVLAGAVAVAPDFPEWNVAGCLKYRNDFGKVLSMAANLGIGYHTAGVGYIQENLMLSRVNKSRETLLEGLVGK